MTAGSPCTGRPGSGTGCSIRVRDEHIAMSTGPTARAAPRCRSDGDPGATQRVVRPLDAGLDEADDGHLGKARDSPVKRTTGRRVVKQTALRSRGPIRVATSTGLRHPPRPVSRSVPRSATGVPANMRDRRREPPAAHSNRAREHTRLRWPARRRQPRAPHRDIPTRPSSPASSAKRAYRTARCRHRTCA